MSAWDGKDGRGLEGRLLGLKLMEQAQAGFWSSWNSGWIDDGLAKAAFVSGAFSRLRNVAHEYPIYSSLFVLVVSTLSL